MDLPHQFIQTTEAQLGAFARRQLVSHVGGQRADDVLRSGWCDRLLRGVYRVTGGACAPEQAALAAALRTGPRATLSGPAALRLMGFLEGTEDDDPFLILVPEGRRVDKLDFHTRTDPDPDRAVATWGDIRVAGPLDALIDSAEFVDEVGGRRLRLAHDILRWRGLLRPGRLAARILELGDGAPGGHVLDELLALDATDATSDGERRLGDFLSRFDPKPEPQVWVTPSRRLDWYFRSLRYGYEYQGSVDHGTVAGRVADDARDTELRREGIRLAYVTVADLEDESTLLGTVASALTVRAHELGMSPPTLRPA